MQKGLMESLESFKMVEDGKVEKLGMVEMDRKEEFEMVWFEKLFKVGSSFLFFYFWEMVDFILVLETN